MFVCLAFFFRATSATVPSAASGRKLVQQLLVPSKAASPAVHVSVLMVDRQTGDLPLEFPKHRRLCQIGAQQQTTQDVSVGEKEEEKM